PPCRTAAERDQSGRAVLRQCSGQLKAEPLPPGFRTRCEALAREHAARGRRPVWRAGLVPGTITALLILIGGIFVLSLATHRVDGQDVSLYMLEGVQRPPAEVMALGHRTRIWSHGATTYVMVSSARPRDFARVAQYVMQEAH